jgi:sulfite exporter TauE/SafE
MTALVLAVLASSLVGSLHCAAMCGSFVCLAGSRGSAWYHSGRLVSYVVLGLVAGGLGGLLDSGAALAGIQQGAAVLASLLLVVWGLSRWLAARGTALPWPTIETPARRWLGNALAALRDQPAALRGAALGLLTTLLPCGWLYAFVVAAGGTGSAERAALVMSAFWVGTVPALAMVGVGVRRLSPRMTAALPQWSAATIVVVGVLSLAWRMLPAGANVHAH